MHIEYSGGGLKAVDSISSTSGLHSPHATRSNTCSFVETGTATNSVVEGVKTVRDEMNEKDMSVAREE